MTIHSLDILLSQLWTSSIVPCPISTVASWPTYSFLRRQIKWSGIPISFRIFQFIVIHTFCHKGGVICIFEVIDISPSDLDSSLCFIQPSILHDILCIEVKWAGWQYTTLTYSFPNLEPACCSMSSSNCCFLTCIQISQETGKVVWYFYLFKNSPENFLKKNFPVGTMFTCQDVTVAWTSACHSVLPLFWWDSSLHLPHLCLTVLLTWSVRGEGRR